METIRPSDLIYRDSYVVCVEPNGKEFTFDLPYGSVWRVAAPRIGDSSFTFYDAPLKVGYAKKRFVLLQNFIVEPDD